VCVRFTSVDAYNRGYQVTLVYEGIESFKEPKGAAVAYLNWVINADCINLDDFRDKAFSGASEGPGR
jgi:nicotinamidase-related amidase